MKYPSVAWTGAAAVAAAFINPGVGWSHPEPTRGESSMQPSVAFHYGPKPPLRELSVFDWVVLDPAGAADPSKVAPAIPLAYVALGEVSGSAPWAASVEESWVLGRNLAWGSRIMDLAQPGWRALILQEALPALWEQGFRGFFFDTLDSHVAVLADPEQRALRFRALTALIRMTRQRFPEAVIIVNRGFEVLPELAPFVSAVAAESLFAGWDPEGRRYRPVPSDDRQWLFQRLEEARRLGLVTIAIDYVPPQERKRAQQIARQIADAGHVPWVAPAELDGLGVGLLEVLPRKVLLLYDGDAYDLEQSPVHRLLALPLEHLGLTPRYVDASKGLPAHRLRGELAGIVAWLGTEKHRAALRSFILRHRQDGLPVVLFGTPDQELLGALGFESGPAYPTKEVRLIRGSSLLGFEAPPRTIAYAWSPIWSDAKGFEPLMELGIGPHRHQPIVLTPWGGVALDPYVYASSVAEEVRWVIDPFAFFQRALQLPPMPVVDPTTENGRRLLIIHIDGDGAPSRAELPRRPLALSVIRRRVEQSALPHTVSVVEGETSSAGRHPELAEPLEREARLLFALPHVAAASHGFSHPFVWSAFEAGQPSHLALRGGTPSLEREILGSLRYVSNLAGRSVDLFLWTGDALPGPRSLALLSQHRLRNMNGGFTLMTNTRPSVTHVSPLGRPVGGKGQTYFQVYAPMMNENVYTNGWKGPFWGYRRVIETFELTGRPRRLLPLGIYYHFYSGTKRASLRALDQVYADALRREPLAIYASTWIDKVLETRRVVLARRHDGRLLVDGLSTVRTLRVPAGGPGVNLDRSEGVIGHRSTPVGRYVHFDGRRRAVLALSRSSEVEVQGEGPVLVEASAPIRAAVRDSQKLDVTFGGSPPFVAVVNEGHCVPASHRRVKEGLRIILRDTARLRCSRSTGR